jgi:monoamine oxidase
LDARGRGPSVGSCSWLHSADRNAWTRIAEASGFVVGRREPAWGVQYGDLGFTPAKQAAARQAFAAWTERLVTTPPASDRASDVLSPDGTWNAYLGAMVGFISGAKLERLSAADYIAYDAASTDHNWRVPAGYGSLIASSLPATVALQACAKSCIRSLPRRGAV